MLNYSFIGKVIHKHIWETASLNCESSKKKAERVGGREGVDAAYLPGGAFFICFILINPAVH